MQTNVRAAAERTLAGIALVACVLLLVPFEPVFCPPGAAPGWPTRMIADFAENRRFGVETVFTYGPLGLVPLRGYYPGTYSTLLLGSAVVAAALIAASMCIFRRSRVTTMSAALLTLLVTAVATSQLGGVGTEPIFSILVLLVPLLAVTRGTEQPNPALDLLMGLALAVAGLGKFNYFVGAAGVIAAVSALELHRRRTPWIAVSVIAFVPALWLVAGQAPADLPRYILGSLEFSSGYTEAMSLRDLARDAVPIVEMAALASLFAILALGGDQRRFPKLIIRAGWVFSVFLVFKTAVVRQDEHVLSASVTLLAAGILLAAITRDGPLLARAASGTAILFSLIGATVSLAALDDTPASLLGSPPSTLLRQGAAALRLAADPGWMARRHAESLATARAATRLPEIRGSVDYLPNSSMIPLAHGLDRRENPVVMSYVAPFTPALAEMQAAHLRAADGPQNLVVSFVTIDDRYPTLDFGAALLEMMSRYESTTRMNEALLLTRRPAPRKLTIERALDVEAKPGREVDIARLTAGGESPIWARITIRGTRGRAVGSLLYRSPVFTIRTTTHGGSVRVKRFIPEGGRAGFLLSPYLDDGAAFGALLTATPAADTAVTGVSIDVEPTLVPQMSSVRIELWKIVEAK